MSDEIQLTDTEDNQCPPGRTVPFANIYLDLAQGRANAFEEKPTDVYFKFIKKNLLRRKTFPINFRSKIKNSPSKF